MPQPCDPLSGFEGFYAPLEHALPRMVSPCAADIWLTWRVAHGLQRKLKVQWKWCRLGICSRINWENIPAFLLGTCQFEVYSPASVLCFQAALRNLKPLIHL